jgi:hypothetical protein
MKYPVRTPRQFVDDSNERNHRWHQSEVRSRAIQALISPEWKLRRDSYIKDYDWFAPKPSIKLAIRYKNVLLALPKSVRNAYIYIKYFYKNVILKA